LSGDFAFPEDCKLKFYEIVPEKFCRRSRLKAVRLSRLTADGWTADRLTVERPTAEPADG